MQHENYKEAVLKGVSVLPNSFFTQNSSSPISYLSAGSTNDHLVLQNKSALLSATIIPVKAAEKLLVF